MVELRLIAASPLHLFIVSPRITGQKSWLLKTSDKNIYIGRKRLTHVFEYLKIFNLALIFFCFDSEVFSLFLPFFCDRNISRGLIRLISAIP